jgi:hypothetical protein
MNIAEWATKGKEWLSSLTALLARVPRDVLVVAIVLLSASLAFGLGYLTGRDAGQGSDFGVTQMPLTQVVADQPAGATPEPAPAVAAGGQYVASKSGTKYYLPWCGGVKAIKDANKVWFATKAAAEASGYTPAANCKGI